MSIINLKSSDFQKYKNSVYINNNSISKTPGILLVWATWCGHCTRFKPIYQELARKLGNDFQTAAIEHSELQKSPSLSSDLDVQYFPTIKFFDQHGKIIATYPDGEERDIPTILKHICKTYHHCIMHH
jgi:thiol-disulfide isomerase/thioredoxin